MEPKSAWTRAISAGDGAPRWPAGAMVFQKKAWFQAPPALLRTTIVWRDAVATSCSRVERATSGLEAAALFNAS
jgi:hypothetical protein